MKKRCHGIALLCWLRTTSNKKKDFLPFVLFHSELWAEEKKMKKFSRWSSFSCSWRRKREKPQEKRSPSKKIAGALKRCKNQCYNNQRKHPVRKSSTSSAYNCSRNPWKSVPTGLKFWPCFSKRNERLSRSTRSFFEVFSRRRRSVTMYKLQSWPAMMNCREVPGKDHIANTKVESKLKGKSKRRNFPLIFWFGIFSTDVGRKRREKLSWRKEIFASSFLDLSWRISQFFFLFCFLPIGFFGVEKRNENEFWKV